MASRTGPNSKEWIQAPLRRGVRHGDASFAVFIPSWRCRVQIVLYPNVATYLLWGYPCRAADTNYFAVLIVAHDCPRTFDELVCGHCLGLCNKNSSEESMNDKTPIVDPVRNNSWRSALQHWCTLPWRHTRCKRTQRRRPEISCGLSHIDKDLISSNAWSQWCGRVFVLAKADQR